MEYGLTIKDKASQWRGLHETENHHPLMEGAEFRKFWRDRGFSNRFIEKWVETLDVDIHRAISDSGWWEDMLMGRISALEEAQGGLLATPEQVLREAFELLDDLSRWSP